MYLRQIFLAYCTKFRPRYCPILQRRIDGLTASVHREQALPASLVSPDNDYADSVAATHVVAALVMPTAMAPSRWRLSLRGLPRETPRLMNLSR